MRDGFRGGPKMGNWADKIQVKKGDYGEKIVREYLENKGWIVYEPRSGGPHAFDKICVKDKKYIIIAEVKTKARMNKWNATGFDIKHYFEYKNLQTKYGIDVFIFFVDEYMKQIYGNKLSILEKEYIANDGKYPRQLKNEIIIFSLESMIKVADIKEEDSQYLKENSSRNYNYRPL